MIFDAAFFCSLFSLLMLNNSNTIKPLFCVCMLSCSVCFHAVVRSVMTLSPTRVTLLSNYKNRIKTLRSHSHYGLQILAMGKNALIKCATLQWNLHIYKYVRNSFDELKKKTSFTHGDIAMNASHFSEGE